MKKTLLYIYLLSSVLFCLIDNCLAEAKYIETDSSGTIVSQGIIPDDFNNCFCAKNGNSFLIDGVLNGDLAVKNKSDVLIRGDIVSHTPPEVGMDEDLTLSVNNGRIRITGNVLSNGSRNIAVFSEHDALILVEGSIESDSVSLYLETNTNTIVWKNVESRDGSAIVIDLQRAFSGNKSRIIVYGKVISGSSDSVIRIDQWELDTDICIKNLPQIIVFEMENLDCGRYVSGAEDEKLEEALLSSIQYIVKVENENIVIDGYTGSVVTEDQLQVYPTATSGTNLLVKPALGYKLIDVYAGDKAKVVSNSDGTFTVIVRDGGGVTISANCVPEYKLPQTGDNSHVALWLTILALAGTAILTLKRKTA